MNNDSLIPLFHKSSLRWKVFLKHAPQLTCLDKLQPTDFKAPLYFKNK